MTVGTLLIVILIVVAILAIGLVLVPYLRSKGFLGQHSVDTTKQLLQIAKLILQSIKINNDSFKNNADLVFNITQNVVQYIDQTMSAELNEDKKKYAVQTTIEILKSLGIEVSEDIRQLIEIGIESAVNAMKKNK